MTALALTLLLQSFVGTLPTYIGVGGARIDSICDVTRGNLIYVTRDGQGIAMAVIQGGCGGPKPEPKPPKPQPICRNKVGAIIPCPEKP